MPSARDNGFVAESIDALSKFNREDWADKPYLIELRGGGAEDGKRFRWHELPYMWRQPEQLPASLEFAADALSPESGALSGMRIANYRPTGSVTDEGAHVYQLDRYE